MIGQERNVINAAKDSWATYWISKEKGSRQGMYLLGQQQEVWMSWESSACKEGMQKRG